MSSSLKDLQCIVVCKVDGCSASKSVTLLTHKSRQAAESPSPVHQLTNHVGRLVLLAGREHHWIAPVRLTAAQPGPWLRPATYRLSRIGTPNHAEPDKGHPVKTQKRQTNSSSMTQNKTPGGGQSKGRGAKTRALGGAKRVPSLVTLEKQK